MSAAPGCRIITFYSYKGGTGRSMALANVAWILAAAGKRVLAIDWDLEAPGLNRYFHPFLTDKELATTPGLMDFLWEFVLKARDERGVSQSREWYLPYTDLIRCAIPLDWDFPGDGVLHLVSAGRQNPDYPRLVAQFDWNTFYVDMRGGVFLEVVKKNLRERYDYVLIDSRTGLSDTSGICAVQMPDDLVCCFTLNSQNILGTAAVTDSAFRQRIKPNREPGLIIWPVPTRVESAERDRLERSRTFARAQFGKYLKHMKRPEQDTYWRRIEVPYVPYYAYEEVLATFRDMPQHTGSLLYPLEELTRYLTRRRGSGSGESDEGSDVTQMAAMPESARRDVLKKFARPAASRDLVVLLDDWSRADAATLVDEIRAEILRSVENVEVVTTSALRELSEAEADKIRERTELAVVVATKDRGALERGVLQLAEITQPLLKRLGLSGLDIVSVSEQHLQTDLRRLIVQIKGLLVESAQHVDNADDPQKGRWGGSPSSNDRELSAVVTPITPVWFEIRLTVKATGSKPLTGDVRFFLHPTFRPDHRRVPVRDDAATLILEGWGAFTVGAACDDGLTRLELDLAEQEGLDPDFRAR